MAVCIRERQTTNANTQPSAQTKLYSCSDSDRRLRSLKYNRHTHWAKPTSTAITRLMADIQVGHKGIHLLSTYKLYTKIYCIHL